MRFTPRADGGFRFNSPDNPRQTEVHCNATWKWIRGLGGRLVEGINLTKVSLPVEIFEDRSFPQRLPDSWAQFDLLLEAAKCADPVERLRLMVAFAISGLVNQVSPAKPFNPILGETFQAEYACGAQVYAEQVSHHPPVSCWEVVDSLGRFRFTGTANWTATTRANSVKAHQMGLNRVAFSSDCAEVTWNLPNLNLRNILFGERNLKYYGTMVFEDLRNNLRLDLQVDPNFETGFSLGGTFRSKGGVEHDVLRGEIMRGGKAVDEVCGSWLTHVAFAESARVYWRIGNPGQFPEPPGHPLPSDSSFRGDLRAVSKGDMGGAQEWKHRLEERQRKDAKLRKLRARAKA